MKLSSLAVNIFELMIDRRHPDGGLRVLYISCLFEILYPSFSFFFRFKISVFHSCMRTYEFIQSEAYHLASTVGDKLLIRCYPGDVSAACLFCRDTLLEN